MKTPRLYNGVDSESHFSDIDMPLKYAGDIGRLSERIPAIGIIFRETEGDTHYRWHDAPNRQFIILLEGEFEIEVGDGTRRRFDPCDVLLVEDTEGHGHYARIEQSTEENDFRDPELRVLGLPSGNERVKQKDILRNTHHGAGAFHGRVRSLPGGQYLRSHHYQTGRVQTLVPLRTLPVSYACRRLETWGDG